MHAIDIHAYCQPLKCGQTKRFLLRGKQGKEIFITLKKDLLISQRMQAVRPRDQLTTSTHYT